MKEEPQFKAELKIIKEWYKKQPHLPKDVDENVFLSFIAGTKSLERCKEKLDAFLSSRNDLYDKFKEFEPMKSTFKEKFRGTGMCFLPGTTKEGYHVLFCAPNKLGSTDLDTLFCGELIMLELMLNMWPTSPFIVHVSDYQYFSSNIIKKMNLVHLSSFVKFLTNKLPIGFKKSLSMNVPPFIETILAFVGSVIPAKLKERLMVSSKQITLAEHIAIEMVPADYGGQGPPHEQLVEEWISIIESHQEWFANRKKQFVCNENMRPKDSAYRKEGLSFGAEGSFKSLSID